MDRDIQANPYEGRGTEAGIYPDTVLNPITENPTKAIMADRRRRSASDLMVLVAGWLLVAAVVIAAVGFIVGAFHG